MSKLRMGYLFLGIFTISACTQSENSSEAKAVELESSEKLTALKCEKGEPVYFRLVDDNLSDPVPSSDEFGLPCWVDGVYPEQGCEPWKLNQKVSTKDYFWRLDMCRVDDEIQLKRVVSHSPTRNEYIMVDKDATVQGLKELIFDDQYSSLRITVPYTEYALKKAVEIKGSDKFSRVAIAETTYSERDKTNYYEYGASIGRFEFDDFKEASDEMVNYKKCGGNVTAPQIDEYGKEFWIKEMAVQYENLTIHATAYVNGTATTASVKLKEGPMGLTKEGYDSWPQISSFGSICKISITDSSPKMGNMKGVELKNFGENKTDMKILYEQTTHSIWDAFSIVTPYSTYTFCKNNFETGCSKSSMKWDNVPLTGNEARFTYPSGFIDFPAIERASDNM